MAANRGIASAIEDCYDAALEFGRWPKALQNLADCLDAARDARLSFPGAWEDAISSHGYAVENIRRRFRRSVSEGDGIQLAFGTGS